MTMTANAEFRRGWKTLLASSLGYGSGLGGLSYYAFGVFVLPLVAAFGWQRGDVATAASFLILGTAITAPIVGGFIDRFGAYRVMLISFALLAVGYCLLTLQSDQIGLFYAAWLAMSLVGGGTTPVVWTRNVTLWFDRGRGLALGFALAGSGVTAMLAPPIINHVIDRWGWQGGYLAIAAFVGLVALPAIALLYKDRPDVEVHPSAAQPTPAVEGLSMAEALRAPAFWKIALGFFFVSAVIAGLIINLIPLLVDRGLDRANAAQVAGVMGTAVLLGRIGIGWLLDRVSAPLVAGALLLLCGLGFLLLTREHLPMPVIWFCVIALGFGAAAEVDLVAYLTGRYLGMKAYGRIYGLQLTFFYIGAAIGPALIGKAYDNYQDYNPSLYFAVGALAFGAAVLSLLGRPAFARAGH